METLRLTGYGGQNPAAPLTIARASGAHIWYHYNTLFQENGTARRLSPVDTFVNVIMYIIGGFALLVTLVFFWGGLKDLWYNIRKR